VFALGGNDFVFGSNFDDNLWGGVSNDFLTGGGASNMILLDRQGAELRGWTVLFITWDLPWAAGPEPA
jgi:hypothetical protein